MKKKKTCQTNDNFDCNVPIPFPLFAFSPITRLPKFINYEAPFTHLVHMRMRTKFKHRWRVNTALWRDEKKIKGDMLTTHLLRTGYVVSIVAAAGAATSKRHSRGGLFLYIRVVFFFHLRCTLTQVHTYGWLEAPDAPVLVALIHASSSTHSRASCIDASENGMRFVSCSRWARSEAIFCASYSRALHSFRDML